MLRKKAPDQYINQGKWTVNLRTGGSGLKNIARKKNDISTELKKNKPQIQYYRQ